MLYVIGRQLKIRERQMDRVENQRENIAHPHVLCGCCGVNFCPCKPCVWWLKLIIIFLPAILVFGILALVLGFAIAVLFIPIVVCGLLVAKNRSECCKDSGKLTEATEFTVLALANAPFRVKNAPPLKIK